MSNNGTITPISMHTPVYTQVPDEPAREVVSRSVSTCPTRPGARVATGHERAGWFAPIFCRDF